MIHGRFPPQPARRERPDAARFRQVPLARKAAQLAQVQPRARSPWPMASLARLAALEDPANSCAQDQRKTMNTGRNQASGVVSWAACLAWLLMSASGQAAPKARPASAAASAVQRPAGSQLPGLAAFGRVTWQPNAPRERLCDFAAVSAKSQGLAMQDDPLWRPPPPDVKAKLGEARKALMGQKVRGSEAERQLLALLNGAWGLTLGRMAVQDKDPLVATITLEALLPHAAAEPRLASLALVHTTAPEVERAVAAVHLMGASRCDSALLFVLDALGHNDPRVGIAAAEAVYAAGPALGDGGVQQRMLAWVQKREGKSSVRVAALRVVGELGYLAAGNDLVALASDPDAAVAAEALAALGRVAPLRAEPLLNAALQSKQPLLRAGGIRAAARALSMKPSTAQKLLQPLLADRTALVDPVYPDRPALTVGAVAEAALAHIRGER